MICWLDFCIEEVKLLFICIVVDKFGFVGLCECSGELSGLCLVCGGYEK